MSKEAGQVPDMSEVIHSPLRILYRNNHRFSPNNLARLPSPVIGQVWKARASWTFAAADLCIEPMSATYCCFNRIPTNHKVQAHELAIAGQVRSVGPACRSIPVSPAKTRQFGRAKYLKNVG